MSKNSLVIEAGRMALVLVGWAVIIILALYSQITSKPSSTPSWLLWQGIILFLTFTLLSGWIAVDIFFRMLGSMKKPRSNSPNDWALLITVLAAAFAVGGIFQAVSTIGSQTVSVSSCVFPPNLNVTSLNCVRTQTITHTEGPNLYFGQIGLYMIALAIVGAMAFAISYIARIVKTSLA